MTRVEQKLKLTDEKFKRRIGTTQPVFLLMFDILQAAYGELHKSGGKPPDLWTRCRAVCMILRCVKRRCLR